MRCLVVLTDTWFVIRDTLWYKVAYVINEFKYWFSKPTLSELLPVGCSNDLTGCLAVEQKCIRQDWNLILTQSYFIFRNCEYKKKHECHPTIHLKVIIKKMQNDHQQHIWIPKEIKWPSGYANQLQLFPFQNCPVSILWTRNFTGSDLVFHIKLNSTSKSPETHPYFDNYLIQDNATITYSNIPWELSNNSLLMTPVQSIPVLYCTSQHLLKN